jgi:hypothetical protein
LAAPLAIDADNQSRREDGWIDMADEPDRQDLCDREQAFFLQAICEDLDLSDGMDNAKRAVDL